MLLQHTTKILAIVVLILSFQQTSKWFHQSKPTQSFLEFLTEQIVEWWKGLGEELETNIEALDDKTENS